MCNPRDSARDEVRSAPLLEARIIRELRPATQKSSRKGKGAVAEDARSEIRAALGRLDALSDLQIGEALAAMGALPDRQFHSAGRAEAFDAINQALHHSDARDCLGHTIGSRAPDSLMPICHKFR